VGTTKRDVIFERIPNINISLVVVPHLGNFEDGISRLDVGET